VKRTGVVATVLAFAVAGCGGGSNGRLSHGEFVKRADALCRTSVAKLRQLPNPKTLPQLVTYLKQARPIQETFLADSRKLRPPAKDEADWRRAIAFDEQVLRYYDEMAAAVNRGDRNTLRRVQAALRALPAKNPYEQRLGLQGC
jgi:hypothetical protein